MIEHGQAWPPVPGHGQVALDAKPVALDPGPFRVPGSMGPRSQGFPDLRYWLRLFYGHRWIAIDMHGLPRKFTDIQTNAWTSMDIHGHPWIAMDIHTTVFSSKKPKTSFVEQS